MPPLRRAYIGLPWPHLYQYPESVGSVAVERDYRGEPAVFFGRINNPAAIPLRDIDAQVRGFASAPVESVRPFRKARCRPGSAGQRKAQKTHALMSSSR